MSSRFRYLISPVICLISIPLFAQTTWRYDVQQDTGTIVVFKKQYNKDEKLTYNLATGRLISAGLNDEKPILQHWPPFGLEDGSYLVTQSKQIKRLDTWTVKYRSEYLRTADPADKDAKKQLDKKLSKYMEDVRVIGYYTATKEFIVEKEDQVRVVKSTNGDLQERMVFDLNNKIKVKQYSLSPAGKFLVASVNYPSIKNYIIELATGKFYIDLDISAVEGNFNYVFTPDDQQLLVDDMDDKLYRIYQLPAGEMVQEYPHAALANSGDRIKEMYFDQHYFYIILPNYLDRNAPFKPLKPITDPVIQVIKRAGTDLQPIQQYWLGVKEAALPPFKGLPATEIKQYSYDQFPKDHAKLISYFKPIKPGFSLNGFNWDPTGYKLVEDSTLKNIWCFLTCESYNFHQYKNLYALGKLWETDKVVWLLVGLADKRVTREAGKPFEMEYSVHQYDKVEKRFRGSTDLGKRSYDPQLNSKLLQVAVYENFSGEIKCVTPKFVFSINKKS